MDAAVPVDFACPPVVSLWKDVHCAGPHSCELTHFVEVWSQRNQTHLRKSLESEFEFGVFSRIVRSW